MAIISTQIKLRPNWARGPSAHGSPAWTVAHSASGIFPTALRAPNKGRARRRCRRSVASAVGPCNGRRSLHRVGAGAATAAVIRQNGRQTAETRPPCRTQTPHTANPAATRRRKISAALRRMHCGWFCSFSVRTGLMNTDSIA